MISGISEAKKKVKLHTNSIVIFQIQLIHNFQTHLKNKMQIMGHQGARNKGILVLIFIKI